MYKIYIFVGIGVSIGAIALIVALSDAPVMSMSLDEILANKDCTALEKWGEDKIYDDNLNLTEEQRSKMMELSIDCSIKGAKNLLGSP